MANYYAQKLSGERLRRCYELAPPRVQQYLEAEIEYALQHLQITDSVLELGCGYGRVTRRLAEVARHVVGVDNAADSIALARELHGPQSHCEFVCADALVLPQQGDTFDAVLCVQNGICAFGVDPDALLREALRVARPGGVILFSTYSDEFWTHRLAWFEAQSAAGLLGPIDYAATGDGVIACTDGFRAGRFTPGEWEALCERGGVTGRTTAIDGSSIFYEITK